ncbi:MAG: chemotaxis protein CheW [Leptospiraceae bacterium]|nr:chemotaxis protein CheW [Leptospiraceae bacterium]
MRSFCTFKLNEISFGIDVLKVLGILNTAEIVRVPLANRTVKGLIQYRGQIITVIDLRRKFELEDRKKGENFLHTIVKTKKGVVSLLVDEVGDIEEITQSTRVEMSKSVQGVDSFFISHTYKFDEYTLLILDVEKIIEVKSEKLV